MKPQTRYICSENQKRVMNIKLYILLFFAVGFFTLSEAQSQVKVNWMTWDQAVEKSQGRTHKILIHIYTEGCTPCKNMDATTFVSPEIVELINNNFYPVKLDARSKKDLTFNGKKLIFKCENGTCFHEFAMQLTNGTLSFPSCVFLDENMDTIGSIPDYKDPKQFASYVKYYAYGYSTKMPFTRFLEYEKRHR